HAAVSERSGSRHLARIVLLAMAAEPANRYPWAVDLARELERYVTRPRRLRRTAIVASGVVGILALLAVLARPGGRTAPPVPMPLTSTAPLRIAMMEVLHFVEDERGHASACGIVGEDVLACRADDVVKVGARLTAPAYCYLIALHPNGQAQCYFPRDEDAPPPRLGEIASPADPDPYSPLTDGIGLQAYVLLASEEPLPSYRAWLGQLGPLPWGPTGPDTEGVWRFDGRTFEQIGPRERSEPRKL